MFWFFDQSIEKELSGTLHYRINSAQKLLIAAELVVIPKMGAQPCTSSGPEAPQWTIDWCGSPPQVRVVMTNPTVSSIVHPRSAATVFY
jgi:hypothetical protein